MIVVEERRDIGQERNKGEVNMDVKFIKKGDVTLLR